MRPMVAFSALFLLSSAVVAAEDDAQEGSGLLQVLENMGIEQKNEIKGQVCRASITVDQDKIIDAIPLLLKSGVLNDEMKKRDFETAPTKTALAIAVQFAPAAIQDVYKNNSGIDKCTFTHALVSDDEYGNSRKDVMFNYMFDRITYSRISWDNFASKNLPKVSKNFQFNPVLMKRIGTE